MDVRGDNETRGQYVVEVEWPDLGAHWLALDRNQYPDEHVHPTLQIGVALRAAPDLRVSWRGARSQRRVDRVPTNGVLVVPAGEPHALDFAAPSELVLIEFAPDLIEPAGGAVAAELGRIRPPGVVYDPVLAALAAAVAAEHRGGQPPGRLYLESVGHVIAAHLLRRYAERDPGVQPAKRGLDAAILRRVLDYIEASPQEDLSIAALARVAGLSPFHFGRLFKAATGQTPYRYVLERRLELGHRLLIASEWPIARVARAVGFADQSHFTRQFARYRGCTPGAVVRRAAAHPRGRIALPARTNVQDQRDADR